MATILTKKKDTSGAPSAGDLTNDTGGAELAVNTADKRLYTKDSGGNVVEVGINPTSITTGTLNTSGAVVFNDAGADVDFRVEGDTEANLLFVDAGNDRVGIGTSSPSRKFQVNDSANSIVGRIESGQSSSWLQFAASGNGTASRIGSPDGSSSANIALMTADTERMRITSAGEVLVGGTTEISSTNALTIERASNAILNLYRSGTSILGGSILGTIDFYGADTTSNTPTRHAYIQAVASATHAAGDNPTDLVFGCTNDGSGTVAEFARFSQGGVSTRICGLYQPTLGDNQRVYFSAYAGTAGTFNRYAELGIYKHSGITNSCGYFGVSSEDAAFNYMWTDNSNVLRISTTITHIGTTSGTVVGTQTSDERLKDISGPVTYGLNEVLAIEPIAFTMKDDPNIAKIGFSAQQVQPIVPEAVYDTKECIDGYTENEETKEQIPNSDRTKLAMEYTQLIPVLVNAVKELSAKNDALEARIATLEANNGG